MKHAKTLQTHMYDGKRRNVGDVYPIRRGDWQLLQKLGRIELVADPAQQAQQMPAYRTAAMAAPKMQAPQWSQYQTAEMKGEASSDEAPPLRIKRAYNRKVIPE